MLHQFDPLSVLLISGPFIFVLIIWLAHLGFKPVEEADQEFDSAERLPRRANFYPVRVSDEDRE
jgi:hypothetical protein